MDQNFTSSVPASEKARETAAATRSIETSLKSRQPLPVIEYHLLSISYFLNNGEDHGIALCFHINIIAEGVSQAGLDAVPVPYSACKAAFQSFSKDIPCGFHHFLALTDIYKAS